MNYSVAITAVLYYAIVFALCFTPAPSLGAEKSPIDPCLDCHATETPQVVQQWEAGMHSKTGVKCYVCHFAEESNTKGSEHNGFFVITAVEVQTCESCHPENAAALLDQFSKGSGRHP